MDRLLRDILLRAGGVSCGQIAEDGLGGSADWMAGVGAGFGLEDDSTEELLRARRHDWAEECNSSMSCTAVQMQVPSAVLEGLDGGWW